MLLRVSLAALTAALGVAVADKTASAPPSTQQLQDQLSALSETLHWYGTTHYTYSSIQPAAEAAHAALLSVARANPKAVPRADEFADALGRLVVESRHLTEISKPRLYRHGFYDGPEFLTASVNEWHHTIKIMKANLERPSGFREPRPLSKMTGHGGNSSKIGKATKPGTEFRDWSEGPTMVVIPTGSYTAGSSEEELKSWRVPEDRAPFERPQRRVTISKPLAFSRTEVELSQFEAFVRETNYKPRGGARWWNPEDRTVMVFNAALDYRNPGFPQKLNYPVVAITRQDARAYAKWLSTVTGHKYRLPTEDEWEWAARGGTNTTFFWGNDRHLEQAHLYANTYDQTSKQVNQFQWPASNVTDGYPYTAPVASFRPNNFGLYDMTANAREFMDDDWIGHLGPGTSKNDGSAHRGPAPFPVVRGAAWAYTPRNLRINYRNAYFCSEVATNMFGIRLVREL